MLLLGSNHFLIYEKIKACEVKAAEDSKVMQPKCGTNNKEMAKDREGTIEIGNSRNCCDQFMASVYTVRTVK